MVVVIERAWRAVANALKPLTEAALATLARDITDRPPPPTNKLQLAIARRVAAGDEAAAMADGIQDLDVRACDALALYAAMDLRRRGKANPMAALHSALAAALAAWAEQASRERTAASAAVSLDHLRRQKAS